MTEEFHYDLEQINTNNAIKCKHSRHKGKQLSVTMAGTDLLLHSVKIEETRQFHVE